VRTFLWEWLTGAAVVGGLLALVSFEWGALVVAVLLLFVCSRHWVRTT
jgi:hypothetical protein